MHVTMRRPLLPGRPAPAGPASSQAACNRLAIRVRPWPVRNMSKAVGCGSSCALAVPCAALPSLPVERLAGSSASRSHTSNVHRWATCCSSARWRASAMHAASMSTPTHRHPYCAAAWCSSRPSPQPRSQSTSSELSWHAASAGPTRAEAQGTKGAIEWGPSALHRASVCRPPARSRW
eukprot:scaffold33937_cov30-Tisochrysis_lutea.AAC.3